MKIIAFETSGKHGSVAAIEATIEDLALVHQQTLPKGTRSAQTLAPALLTLLDSLGWNTDDLDAVAVATGPGSFTGLRVGVTSAKVLAYSSECDIVQVNTLSIIASQVPAPSAPVWAAMDAQRDEVFAARFESPSAAPNVELLKTADWLERLAPGEVVTGPILHKLEDDMPGQVDLAPAECWDPTAEAVGRLAIAQALDDDFVSPMNLAPHYYRLSAAEEKALSR